jgi:uncharacterized protein (DUF302 family)
MMFARMMAVPWLILGLAQFSAVPAEAQGQGVWVVKTSPHSVAVTVAKLSSAIEGAGAGIAAVVDHAAGAKKAGMELPPTTLVIFGNPRLGTPLMQQNRQVGIDLPMRVLVWQDGDATKIGYVSPESMASGYGIAADNASISKMTGALDKLTNAATAQ